MNGLPKFIWSKALVVYRKVTFGQKLILILCSAGALTLYAQTERQSKTSLINYEPLIETPTDSIKYRQIDQLLSEAFAKGRFNGSVLYAEDGKILYNRCFGYENLKSKSPLSDTSVYQLASTSKPITSIAILQLHQARKLDINQAVVFYLPDFPFKGVTIKQLLQHRSGLPNYIYQPWSPAKRLTNGDLSNLFRRQKSRLAFTPGTRFQYCNTNYAYLALIVETVSGQTFRDYIHQHIFAPLGMRHSFVYDGTMASIAHAVKGYDYSRRGFYQRDPDYLDGVVGDKGVYSTAYDLFLFDQALYNYSFLARSLVEQAFTPAQAFSAKHDRDYGLGFRVKLDLDGSPMAYHHGWWKGFRTYFVHDYNKRRTLIWLNNRSDVQISSYMNKILESSASDDDQPALGGGER